MCRLNKAVMTGLFFQQNKKKTLPCFFISTVAGYTCFLSYLTCLHDLTKLIIQFSTSPRNRKGSWPRWNGIHMDLIAFVAFDIFASLTDMWSNTQFCPWTYFV